MEHVPGKDPQEPGVLKLRVVGNLGNKDHRKARSEENASSTKLSPTLARGSSAPPVRKQAPRQVKSKIPLFKTPAQGEPPPVNTPQFPFETAQVLKII